MRYITYQTVIGELRKYSRRFDSGIDTVEEYRAKIVELADRIERDSKEKTTY